VIAKAGCSKTSPSAPQIHDKTINTSMLDRFLGESSRIHDVTLGPRQVHDEDFILVDHPLDTWDEAFAVQRLEEYMKETMSADVVDKA